MNEPMEQEQTWEYQFDELFPELEEWNGDKNAWGEPLFRSRRREVREFIREKLTQARTEERERVKKQIAAGILNFAKANKFCRNKEDWEWYVKNEIDPL